jgi:D-glycero-D-manno-heptose 1,7-bisphosphate phosphatase
LAKAVFLDRDGVINVPIIRDGLPFAPQTASEFAWMDGLHDTLAQLRARGFLLMVCTNQPDVARGTQNREQVEVFHRKIEAELPIARVYACFHDNHHACVCRKPKPGMLLQGGADFDIDMAQSWMVGDRVGDIAAGKAAGCRTIFVRHDYDTKSQPQADFEVTDVPGLLDIIR